MRILNKENYFENFSMSYLSMYESPLGGVFKMIQDVIHMYTSITINN